MLIAVIKRLFTTEKIESPSSIGLPVARIMLSAINGVQEAVAQNVGICWGGRSVKARIPRPLLGMPEKSTEKDTITQRQFMKDGLSQFALSVPCTESFGRHLKTTLN